MYRNLLASSLALALAVSAHAQTVIHIVGSTAFRAATIAAIEAVLSANRGIFTFAYVGSTPGGNELQARQANQTIFKGNVQINGNSVPVVFKTSFYVGSLDGIYNLTNGLTVGTGGTAYPNGWGGWLSDSNLPASGGLVVATNATLDPASAPDVTLSDTFQASTPFTSPSLSGKIVGIVPFIWVKSSAQILDLLTNLSTADAYHLLKGSYIYSGDNKVYAIGLFEDSGTRLAAFENASGGKDNGDIGPRPYPSVPQQYEFETSGTPPLWPANPYPIDGFTYKNAGHGGYVDPQVLAAYLSTATSIPYIGYLNVNDLAGGYELTFNGWPYSPSYVYSGHYTFWAYEHFLYLPTLSGTALAVVQQLASEVTANASFSGLPLNNMKVHRNGDGQPILQGGTPPNVP